jgi:hypothetical protein
MHAIPPKIKMLYCFGCLIILEKTATTLMTPTKNKMTPGIIKFVKGVSFKNDGFKFKILPLGTLIINHPVNKDINAINVANVYNKVFIVN